MFHQAETCTRDSENNAINRRRCKIKNRSGPQALALSAASSQLTDATHLSFSLIGDESNGFFSIFGTTYLPLRFHEVTADYCFRQTYDGFVDRRLLLSAMLIEACD